MTDLFAGASAVADVLRTHSRADVRVFVVWEPILITDWRRPGPSQTAYLPDPRATHFWDPAHRLSALYGGRANLPALAANEEVGFPMRAAIWDAALVYPPAHNGDLPPPCW